MNLEQVKRHRYIAERDAEQFHLGEPTHAAQSAEVPR
jgi:hypothetical protein